MEKVQILMFFASLLLTNILAEECLHPPPAESFTNERYSGRWYEIGKIQTPGGAEFQKGAVCTIATFDPYEPLEGDGDIGYSSRKDTPDGQWVNATGVLTHLEAPGHFRQQLYFFGVPGPTVDYNVIWLDDESAIEYDCNTSSDGITDYCLHFMSRKPTLSEEKLTLMLEFAASMNLNTDEIEYAATPHAGCWEQ